jgi:hypothetical protein
MFTPQTCSSALFLMTLSMLCWESWVIVTPNKSPATGWPRAWSGKITPAYLERARLGHCPWTYLGCGGDFLSHG